MLSHLCPPILEAAPAAFFSFTLFPHARHGLRGTNGGTRCPFRAPRGRDPVTRDATSCAVARRRRLSSTGKPACRQRPFRPADCGSHLQSGTQDAEVRKSPSHCFWPTLACREGQQLKQALDVAVAQPRYIRTWVMVMPRSLNPIQGQLAKTNTLTDYQNLNV